MRRVYGEARRLDQLANGWVPCLLLVCGLFVKRGRNGSGRDGRGARTNLVECVLAKLILLISMVCAHFYGGRIAAVARRRDAVDLFQALRRSICATAQEAHNSNGE